jgi:putative Mn2+ efflux pump MntP
MHEADWLSALLLAAGLSVDSCLVALAYGVGAGSARLRGALTIAAVFGSIQGALLALGWVVGAPIAAAFSRYDHWIAFVVLAAIGVRTIRDGEAEDAAKSEGVPSLGKLALAGVATSIDALAAGFGMSLGDSHFARPVLLTTAMTALGCALCFASGRAVGARFERVAHWIAGLVLIALGASVLVEHLRGGS